MPVPLSDPHTLAKLRAMYEPLMTQRDMRETAGYVVGLIDLVTDLHGELRQSQAEKRALVRERMTEAEAMTKLQFLVQMYGSSGSTAAALGVSPTMVQRALHGDPVGKRMMRVLQAVTTYEEAR
jgi:hypothetical protein